MVSVSYHDTVKDVQGCDWIASSPFSAPDWFALLEAHGHRPVIAFAKDNSGSLALVLERREYALESLRNWYAFSWQPLATGSPQAQQTLLVAIAKDLRGKIPGLSFAPMPEDTAKAMQDCFIRAGWSVEKTACDTNHILDVQGRSFADYWQTRPGKMRTTLKRKAKKVDVRIVQHFDAQIWSDYEAIYADSWKPEEGDPQLLRAFAEQQGTAGHIRLALASHAGEPVAAQFWTVERGTAYIHKLAHRKSAQSLSPGTTLTAALFEHVIDEDRVQWVDFGTGDDPYKADWMDTVRTRYRLDCLDPSAPAAWPRMAKRAARRVAQRFIGR